MTSVLPAIAFIGGGNMASAIIAGLATLDTVPPLGICDPDHGVRTRHSAAGHLVTDDPGVAIAEREVIVLAVKPNLLATAAEAVAPHLRPDQLVVSVLAGTPTASLEAALPAGTRVVRAMPNTPLAIGEGMVGLCAGAHATAADLAQAERLFATCGRVLRVDETMMDALTAVSGSGPAYVFRFAEALVAGATALGFSDTEAQLLVGQTLKGATDYLFAQEGFPAGRLREEVTSPGGTTAAALGELDAGDFMAVVARALVAARDRAQEMAG
ncbi:MAG: pyrroline-5-carboxylate reductase [Planctomycetota bacterium]